MTAVQQKAQKIEEKKTPPLGNWPGWIHGKQQCIWPGGGGYFVTVQGDMAIVQVRCVKDEDGRERYLKLEKVPMDQVVLMGE